ncbi:MAG: SxtJ family membrane protein [Alphaproteobacteria bacterium]
MASRQQIAHERLDHGAPVKGSSDRGFGIVFAVVFALIGCLPLLGGTTPHWWALVVAAVFLALALALPAVLAPLNRLWMKFGLLLHRIVSPLIMGLLFYGVVTPIGMLMRATGKDPMQRRREPEAESYWIVREPGPAPDSMKHQF